MSWNTQVLMPFDLETTGVDKVTARIVTACYGQSVPDCYGQLDLAEVLLADPGIEISAEATAIHGITTEHAREHGEPAANVVCKISLALANAIGTGTPIVGMNLAYDFSVLHRECARYEISTPEEFAGAPYSRIIDVYVLDKQADPYRRGQRRLADLCRHYCVTFTDEHTARADAFATAAVARAMWERYVWLRTVDVVELTDCQRVWRANQARSLEAYFARSGKTEQDGSPIRCDPCWPVCNC